MRSMAGLLTDGVLADAISSQYRDGKGSSKKVRKLVTEKPFTSK